MYLPDTEPMALRIVHSNKQCINLNSNDFRKWYCAIFNPFNLLRLRSAQVPIDNLFRCHKKVPGGCVVSCGQKSNDSKFHVENIGLNNGFGGRHNV